MSPEEIYATFAKKPGANQIASEFACRGLEKWLRTVKPRRVYEVGGGIGTLSQVILSALVDYDKYYVEEENGWCRSMWRKNVQTDRPVKLLKFRGNPTWIDFLVVDAAANMEHYSRILKRRAVVFVEGNRSSQRAALEAAIRHRRWTSAEFRPADRSKGFTVYRLEPTPSERIWLAIEKAHQFTLDLRARAHGRAIGKRRV